MFGELSREDSAVDTVGLLGKVPFFLGGLDFAGAGGGLAVGTTGLAEEEVSGDGLGLAMAGAEGGLAAEGTVQ